MAIIQTHDITLYGGNKYDIILCPLSDEHLPLLYKWCADPEVLYWTEGGADTDLSYGSETVHQIYGGSKDKCLYFLIEADGNAVGECWLQKMNLPYVIEMYDSKLDVRRIDMCIGEKEHWGKGIGTEFIGMMIDFAFYGENVDILHCFCEDYNIRSRRMWEKHGFTLALTEDLPQPQKGKFQYHYTLTRQQFMQNRRYIPPSEEIFYMPLSELQPCQLYISEGKLRLCREWFNKNDISKMDAIPVKIFEGKNLMLDGHSRAVLAYMNGFDSVPCYYDDDELDMAAYAVDVEWCEKENIKSIVDLEERIVSHKEYERLWRKRCMDKYYSNEYKRNTERLGN